jgi:hypothetical protein
MVPPFVWALSSDANPGLEIFIGNSLRRTERRCLAFQRAGGNTGIGRCHRHRVCHTGREGRRQRANRMSIFLFCFFTPLYNPSRSARFATSPRTPVSFFPICATAASRASLRRPVMKTYTPSATNLCAVANPMPLLPPVMTATLSLSFSVVVLIFRCPFVQSRCVAMPNRDRCAQTCDKGPRNACARTDQCLEPLEV